MQWLELPVKLIVVTTQEIAIYRTPLTQNVKNDTPIIDDNQIELAVTIREAHPENMSILTK